MRPPERVKVLVGHISRGQIPERVRPFSPFPFAVLFFAALFFYEESGFRSIGAPAIPQARMYSKLRLSVYR